MKNLAGALVTARANYKPLARNGKNPHYNSKFPTLEDCYAAVDDAIAANGLSVVQFPCTTDTGQPALRTVLLHTSGESLEDVMLLAPTKSDPQAQGSAITYARRYALMAVLGLAPEDDDGNSATGHKAAVVASPPPGTAAAAGATAATVEPVSPPAPVAAPASSFKAPDVGKTPLNQPVEVGSNSKGTLYRVTTDVKHISSASGEKGGKAWTRYDIHLVIAGGEEITLATFSDTLVARCRELAGTTAHITFAEKQNGSYLNRTLVEIEQADLAYAAAAIEQAAAGLPVPDDFSEIPF